MPGRARALDVAIDRKALQHNLEQVKRLAPDARVFAIVKADAYGHGAVEVARTLDAADGFGVVTTGEARVLRDDGERRPILVMQGPRDADDATLCRILDCWPAIHEPVQADWLADSAMPPAAWLKVDTGMGRLGVSMEQVEPLMARSDIDWLGAMSHLGCADTPSHPLTSEQYRRLCSLPVPDGAFRSLANSAAVMTGVGAQLDWVRPGLMLYGCNPLEGGQLPDGVELVPAMTVTAPLIAIKQYPAGAGIGYGHAWTTPEPMPVGYVAAGYADGVPRVLDGSADVMLAGHRCPIVGRVSMDSIAIDLRAVPQASLGDRVTLWGQGQPVERLAASAGTIAYELLTSVRGHVRHD